MLIIQVSYHFKVLIASDWTVWKCVDGQTKHIREHLHMKHWKLYCELVVSEKLKGWEEAAQNPNCPVRQQAASKCEPFSLEGLYTQLVKWIVVDDQVSIILIKYCKNITFIN